jgi:hypothetical protein
VVESRTYPKTIDKSIRFEKKATFKWTDKTQKEFDKKHLLLAANALAAYPDHNKWFGVCTDAFDF